ncbi:MAG: hypothetical protein OCC49_18145 [Fibrobacterales bacterium]
MNMLKKVLTVLAIPALVFADAIPQCIPGGEYDVNKMTFSKKYLTLKEVKKNGKTVELNSLNDLIIYNANKKIPKEVSELMVAQESVEDDEIWTFKLFNSSGIVFEFVRK